MEKLFAGRLRCLVLEVSGTGSREQPQLVSSSVCDVLGVRCHPALASLPGGWGQPAVTL